MAPGEQQATEQAAPFWDEEKLILAITFMGVVVEPPLNRNEADALIGVLNGSQPTSIAEEDIRYQMATPELQPLDSRSLVLRSLKREIRDYEDVIKKELKRINSVAAA